MERELFRSSSVTSYTATLSYTATSTAPGAFRSNAALLEMVPLLLGKSVVIVNRYRECLLVHQEEEMSHSHDAQTQDPAADWINSIEKLIRWIAPRTVGRARVLDRLADVKTARSDRRRLHDALCLLSGELDALYPQGAVISLARRRVRDAALTLVHA